MNQGTAGDSGEHEVIGTGLRAAVSSFCFFACGGSDTRAALSDWAVKGLSPSS
jgi:hypothetical protein